MDKKKIPIPDFKELKRQGKKIRMVTAYDYPTAVIIEKTDIEMILVGDSLGMVVLGYDGTVPVTVEDIIHHAKPVVKGAPNTHIVADMPFMSYQVSIEDAIRNAGRLIKESGADSVKLEGGLDYAPTVKAIVKAGIPVMGHIGLTPQTAGSLGGFKVQGKDAKAAQDLIDSAIALEDAGAFAIVLECIPAPLAKIISQKLIIPTIGIGAGVYCDGQVLVTQDMLGLFDRFVPKFVKQYAQIGQLELEAFNKYAEEVALGVFPDDAHSFSMKEEVIKQLEY
ncbi:ketopantoate hydroxymethyltransferase [Acetomicrobium mobile DSM 13181]|uniref:3-methyl-2-oxobutanoate hydroxymethyltransferase n=1 Tax=Acetomicrobium mobile (strain ATCC BAA-54 / DSM 13181 / JCM 12221 / NGA) TaxID=891968 RepID=I4BY29_ACEMN|nr:3-methyl-2-oxobutanoate hydroxymethyltransferase [Acetomicrobium mobile]AFM22186.1 ketopantoate hydroxymethyltransferase [Acetomicrobium mobile DSM 13181]